MPDTYTYARPPLTLIASSNEWHLRTLESILGPHGYAVLRAYTGRQAIERALGSNPDLILLDHDLPDLNGVDVCRELRSNPRLSRATPIVVMGGGQASRQRRLDALRAGAWDYIGATLDAEELPLRVQALVTAKREVDRVREESLMDELTGLYNLRGLARRAREVGSQALRRQDAFACLVIAPLSGEASEASTGTLEQLAQVLINSGRTSDIVGTLGPGEFAIVAQGTTPEGAQRLAERLAEAAETLFGKEGTRLAIGIDAVPNYSEAPMDPSEMLMRASAAMRASRTQPTNATPHRISRYATPVS